MKKRFLCFMLTLVMLCSLLPCSVFAEDGGTEVPNEAEIQTDDFNSIDETGTPLVPKNTEEIDDLQPPVKEYPTLTVVLKNEADAALAGGAFTLTDSNGAVLHTWSSSEGGYTINDLTEDGEYTLEQTAAPTNYLLGSVHKWKIVLSGEGTLLEAAAYQSDGTMGTAQQGTVESGLTLSVTNVRNHGALEISKTVAFEKEGQPVESADWIEGTDTAVYTLTVKLTDEAGAAVSGTFGTAVFTEGTATLTMKAGDKVTLTDIPCGYLYTVTEAAENAAFISSISPAEGSIGEEAAAVTAVSTYRYESHNAGLNGVWVDATDDEKKLTGTIGLFSDKDCKTQIETVKTEDQGKFRFDITAAGTYYLKELDTPKGYHPEKDIFTVTASEQTVVVGGVTQKRMVFAAEKLEISTAEEGVDAAYSDKVFQFESAPIVAVTVKATVAWNVPDGFKDLPESTSVQLYRDGAAYGEAVVLNKDNKWSHTWSGSGMTDEYSWTVKQVEVPEDYKEKLTDQGGNTFKITNTLQYGKVTVSASVSWLNPKNYDKQPTSAKVVLYRDGIAIETVTLNADNKWTYRWAGLADCFEWTIDEPKVPENYKKKITHVGNAWVVVNAHEEIPLTGDDSNVWLWAAATGVAAVGLAASLFLLLKKHRDDEE